MAPPTAAGAIPPDRTEEMTNVTSPPTAAPDTHTLGSAEAGTSSPARRGTESERTATVVTRRTVADGVVSLELAASSGEPLPPWRPGAHIDVILPSGVTRQYSLCGPVTDTVRWRVAVLREPDGRGGSQWIHDHLVEGGELRVRGPRNNFPLRPRPGTCSSAAASASPPCSR